MNILPQIPHQITLLCSIVLLLLSSCKPITDLDTERRVAAVNLPEITDIAPKSLLRLNRATITITGRNFVDVRKVQLSITEQNSTITKTLTAASFVVESETRIVATFADSIPLVNVGLSRIILDARRGSTVSERYIILGNAFSGRIILDAKPFDSVLFYCTQTLQPPKILGIRALPQSVWAADAVKGYYVLSLNPQDANGTLSSAGDGFRVHPFLSGYTFSPRERVFASDSGEFGGRDFAGKQVKSEEMPQIHDLQPREAVSNSGGEQTGTDITLTGKRLRGVQKMLLGVYYGNPVNPSSILTFEEGSIISASGDSVLVVRLPRLDRRQAFSGELYRNARIYLLYENMSLLAPQMLNVRYY